MATCIGEVAFGGPRSLPYSRKDGVDAGPEVPRSLPLAERRDYRRLVDAFLLNISADDVAAPSQPWGGKLGFSVFDEEEVLGPYLQLAFDYDQEPDSEELDSEEDDDPGEQGYDDDDVFDLFVDAFGLPVSAYAPARADELPRAARLLKPLCHTFCVDGGFADTCAICLEGLMHGDSAWRLPCMHAFHEICMVRYLKVRHVAATCPVCRYDVKQCAAQSVV